jgi:hypothetical protein
MKDEVAHAPLQLLREQVANAAEIALALLAHRADE